MRATIVKTKCITLTLTEREAAILKGMVQNAMCDEEPDELRQFRHDVWDTLKDIKPF